MSRKRINTPNEEFEKSKKFGQEFNLAVRSILHYPENSKDLLMKMSREYQIWLFNYFFCQ